MRNVNYPNHLNNEGHLIGILQTFIIKGYYEKLDWFSTGDSFSQRANLAITENSLSQPGRSGATGILGI